MIKTKNFFKNIMENKTNEYNKIYASRFNYNKMIDEIKVLELPEDKMIQVLEVIAKYNK